MKNSTKNSKFGISVTTLCWLAMAVGSAVLPGMAETVLQSGAYVAGSASGTVVVANNGGFTDWTNLPQINPNQITVTANAITSGAFATNLNFTQDTHPLREYGMTWIVTNNSLQDWYSMHFTIQYAPLGDFSVTFDAGENNGNQPSSIGFGPPANWSDTNIDFYGGPIYGNGGLATFYLPLDVNGKCCNGNFIVYATPDYTPSTPEPSSLALFGSGILGIGGLLRRRFLG